jgi:flagellar motor switch protein FliN
MASALADQIAKIETFTDITVLIDVRVASRATTLQEVLRLDVGTVLSLDKPAGETLDVFVGNLLLASAEPVVLDDQLAVRITDFNLPAAPGCSRGGSTV